MFALLALALAWRELPFWSGLLWAAVYGFFVSLAPILFVLYLLRTGRIVELHMSNTRERHLPYLVATTGSLVVLILLLLFDGPSLLRCLAFFNILVLALLGMINTRWLISFHTTAATAFVAVMGLVFGLWVALLLLPVLVLLVVVRLYLKRHTVAQIVGGLLLGAGAVWALARIGCFVS